MVSRNALAIYQRLYFSKEAGEDSPAQVHRRVAEFVSSAETEDKLRHAYARRYAALMDRGVFRPNSPAMMNAGLTKTRPVLSACFVGHLEDDLRSILELDRESALIFSYGAGIGVNWGVLREKGAPLSTGGEASGPISFMQKLNATANCVKSGGRARRAAIWSGMTDRHPDLLDFIECKMSHPELSAMNLSVTVTDEFMDAVVSDALWELRRVQTGETTLKIPAREIFRKICETAHRTGDPGLIFLSSVNRDHTVPSLGPILSTNPCGEQPLPPHGSCCLGSLNLAAFFDEEREDFDDDAFGDAILDAVRFLDSLLDVQGYPTEAYAEVAKATRNIGLGIMGLADLFLLCGVRYGSMESVLLAERIAKTLTRTAVTASVRLASEKGFAPAWGDPQNREAVLRYMERIGVETEVIEDAKRFGVRNMQWTTIAPTGSVSLSCDCSQGMEPYFALVYEKKLTDSDQTLYLSAPAFERLYGKEAWFSEAEALIGRNKGSCQGIAKVPRKIREIAVCAHDILPSERIAVQAALQRFISSAISSTVYLPRETTIGEIWEIYMEAWKAGLKGITVYRDGSREQQPVSFGKSPQRKTVGRSSVLYGATHKVRTAHGNIYLTVNRDEEGRVVEIFTNGGKNGTADAANLEALARVLSIALQEGAGLKRLAGTLLGINGGESVWTTLSDDDDRAVMISSIPDAVAKVLLRFYVDEASASETSGRKCPECSASLEISEGCFLCRSCGWSKCS